MKPTAAIAFLVPFAVCGEAVWAQSALEVRSTDASGNLVEAMRAETGDEPAPETRFEARRQARRAADRLAEFLNSRGYFAAVASPRVELGPPLVAVVDVETGPRFSVAAVNMDFGRQPPDPSAVSAAREAIGLKPGDVAVPASVEADEHAIVESLTRRGYAYAETRAPNVIGDEAAATVDITYRPRAGPRVRFGAVRFAAGLRTRRTYLERLVPFKEGEIYSPEAVTEFNRRLGETRLYAVYSAQLADAPTTVASGGEEIRDVVVTLTERDRYTIGAGASFSTSEGAGVTLEWTRRNFTRRGDRLKLSTVLAEQQRSINGEWSFPNAFGYGRTLRVSGSGGRDETDAFDREAAVFGATVDIKRGERLTYALGATSEFSRETDAFGQRDLQIFSVSGAARMDATDNALDPTRGWRAEVRVEPGVAIGDAPSTFVSTLGQASAYQPLDENRRWVAAARLRSGVIWGADAVDLPVSRRFFAGGGGSARGFVYQSIGPADDDGTPQGGRALVESSAELRWRRSERLGFAAFVDAASVASRDAPSVDDMRFGAGLGVRYYTAIGPIRFDLATPIDRRNGEDPVQIYLSIGQAF